MKNQNSKFYIFSVYTTTKTEEENKLDHLNTLTELYRIGRLATSVNGAYKGIEETSILIIDEPGVETQVVRLCKQFNQESFLEVSAFDREAKLNYLDGKITQLGKFKAVDKVTALTKDSWTEKDGQFYIVE